METYLKVHGVFKYVEAAGSVDNIQNPMHYRRVMNALQTFALFRRIPLPE